MGKKIKLFGIPILSIEDTTEKKPVLSSNDIAEMMPFVTIGSLKFLALCEKNESTSVRFISKDDDDLAEDLRCNEIDIVTAFIYLTTIGMTQDKEASYLLAESSRIYADSCSSDLEQMYLNQDKNTREALIGLARIQLGFSNLCCVLFNNGSDLNHEEDLLALRSIFEEENIRGPILKRLGFWIDEAA